MLIGVEATPVGMVPLATTKIMVTVVIAELAGRVHSVNMVSNENCLN
jgi:hypothetical protein